MKKYIFYDKTLIAEIENEVILFDTAEIEKSGMSPSWKSRIMNYLLNSIPEGARYDALLSLAVTDGSKPKYEFQLLPFLDDLSGRFTIGDTPVFDEQAKEVKTYVPFPKILPTARIYSKIPAVFLYTQSELRQSVKPSFSGFQDKFVAKLSLEGGEAVVSVPTREERGNVIVKPGQVKYPCIAENEYACMELARSLGFNVPRIFLFQQPDAKIEAERQRKHLIIERFDYALNQRGIYEKLDIAEVASLMDLNSDTKYNTTTEILFKTAEEYFPQEEMKKLARMYFFGVLICNSDMHTKNFSFIQTPEMNYLSPLYDYLCTAIYDFNDTLALPLGGTERPEMEGIINFMKPYISVDEMYEMAEGVKHNISVKLDIAFDLDSPRKQTTRKRLNNVILNRVLSVIKLLTP